MPESKDGFDRWIEAHPLALSTIQSVVGVLLVVAAGSLASAALFHAARWIAAIAGSLILFRLALAYRTALVRSGALEWHGGQLFLAWLGSVGLLLVLLFLRSVVPFTRAGGELRVSNTGQFSLDFVQRPGADAVRLILLVAALLLIPYVMLSTTWHWLSLRNYSRRPRSNEELKPTATPSRLVE